MYYRALPQAGVLGMVSMTGSGSRSPGVRIGIDLSVSDPVGTLDFHDAFVRAGALGVDVLAICAASIERALGAPVVPAAAQPLSGDSVELGLTPLEEEVLRDEVDQAQRAFATLVRHWRTTAPLTTLETLRHRTEAAGVGIASVTWPELARWSDEEIDYAFRATRTLGASVVTTPMSIGLARRLGPFADRHAVRLGILGQLASGGSDFEVALGHGAMVSAAIDTADWTAGRHGPLLPFLARYADQITHIRLRDCTATGAPVPLGRGVAPISELLQAMRDRGWTFPALVAAEGGDGNTSATAVLEQALAFCRSCLAP